MKALLKILRSNQRGMCVVTQTTGRQAGRQTDRQAGRQTDRHTHTYRPGMQASRQTDRLATRHPHTGALTTCGIYVWYYQFLEKDFHFGRYCLAVTSSVETITSASKRYELTEAIHQTNSV